MKKSCAWLLLLALLAGLLPAASAAGPASSLSVTFYNEQAGRYEAPVETDLVALTMDGEALDPGGVPALVQYPVPGGNGRTLVPVRLVAERLGAQVLWVAENRQVLLLQGDDVIVLTLGSSSALVNGQRMELPGGVPAGVVKYQGKESTMVPLRFVSEQLGAEITWDNDTFTANLSSPGAEPGPAPEPTPTPIPSRPDLGQVTGVVSNSDAQTVQISTDHTPAYRVLDLGDRVVVDVVGTQIPGGDNLVHNIPVDNDLITAVRYAQHRDDLGYNYAHTVRVVLDLKPGISYARNIAISGQRGGILITAFLNEGDREPPTFVPSTPIDPSKSTVVIDPGHGGDRSGAVYEEIMEKDLTLSISKKLQALLVAAGYNVVLTREDDRGVDLYERADIANAVEADLFVSIHCNASGTVPEFQGIYTYYHPSSGRGARLAQAIQTPLCQLTGAIDRGIKDADFVVLRETNMCAVLVETGFMSNHEELAKLCDSAYQDKIAQGVAEGVIRYLNNPLNTLSEEE